MVLIGLLLAALVCIALGVVFASGPWFIGSLVASALAGYVLWRQREEISGRAGKAAATGARAPTASRQTSLVTGTAFAGKTGPAGDESGPAGDKTGPAGDKTVPGGAPAPSGDVWVVDGQPHYHREACAEIDGLDAEAISYAQAVEDGFAECEICRPDVAAHVNQVWVIDGRPEYHADGCVHLTDGSGEHIPRAQAVEDGFTPCPDCRPDGSAPATTPPKVDEAPPEQPDGSGAEPASEAVAEASGDVWVVDGRPRYHLEHCMIIEGQSAEAIPRNQAAEDGFMPCSMCEPNVTRV